jgi:DNA-binding response OmpR family regulator
MLVVESEVAVREALLQARSGEGFRITHADSLEAALRLAGEDAGVVVVVVVGQHDAPFVDPGQSEPGPRVLRFRDLELDPGVREVRRDRRLLELTFTEFRLLELLMRNPRQVLTRHLIFERVWGFDFASTSNTLNVYVGYLRRKTEAAGGSRLIHTVRGVGYVLHD